MCRTWQAKPSQVLFSVRPKRNFPQIPLQILSGILGFFRPPRTKTQRFYQNTPTAPFSLATAVGSGDSVKTGQREPMGLWVALLASVRDTVHTYRLLISRDKEVQPVPATANSLPYAVGRDKETKTPSFWESGIKRGVGGDWRNGTQSKTKTQTIKKHRTMIIEYK